jgi:hypothetical protein
MFAFVVAGLLPKVSILPTVEFADRLPSPKSVASRALPRFQPTVISETSCIAVIFLNGWGADGVAGAALWLGVAVPCPGVVTPGFGVAVSGFGVVTVGFGVVTPGFGAAVASGFGVVTAGFGVVTAGFGVAAS